MLLMTVDLPEEVIPDNAFASLLFQNLDLYINHELVTTKSSDSDYAISNMVFMRDGFNEDFLESCEGYFEDRMRDIEDYLHDNQISPGGKIHIETKRTDATQITRDGVRFYRYLLIVGINHGLARQDKPLPSGLSRKITFFFKYRIKGYQLP